MTNIIQNPSVGKRMLSESKFFMGYSRWVESEQVYETWDQSVERVMDMHRKKYGPKMTPQLAAYLAKAQQAYSSQLVLGAQRALQFGGEQLMKHESKMYNCSVSHADRAAFFQEAMYLLLCGCGVGFSVQQRHVKKLPRIVARSADKVKVFQIPDSIEGWADAFGVLLSSYFEDGGTFPEYKGYRVLFDYSLIREKGALISGGFKAPGPDGLRKALVKCEALLEQALKRLVVTTVGAAMTMDIPSVSQISIVEPGFTVHVQTPDSGLESAKLKPIEVYDFVMHMSDAVLSGGVRRSATICLFDKFDLEMMKAKTGDWFVHNPQRGRSNNSVVLKKDEITREEWAEIMRSVKDFGEPGFIFVDDYDFAYNPCVEIGMRPICVETGESGFQFCNLTEINGGLCTDEERFYQACEAGAILGTLQAGYTNFKYLSDATRRITERESLIGVSITGWMNNPDVLFDDRILKKGAEIVKRVNREVAKLLGIRPAARTTCAKPSGNASVILGTASGIHGEHSPLYFRNVQMNEDDAVAKLIQAVNPKMVEKSVWSSNGTDIVVSFPVVTKEGSVYKSDLMGVKQLEFVKKAQQHWVENGTNVDLCVHKDLRHNISNTISVDDWDAVEEYIFENRQHFAGISLLAAAGDKAYAQAPFTEVNTAEEILKKYGDASMFASGLIVDGLHAFNDNLWLACETAMGSGEELSEEARDLLKRDWVRRFGKFSANHFGGNDEKASFCLKDCYNLHKWVSIQQTMQAIDFAQALAKRDDVDADTLGSQGCAGGVCEVTF
jgi:ribonucleoside-triphosphate reductase